MTKVQYSDVVSSLKNLGLCKGDLVFITADLLQVGYFPGSKSKTYTKWLEILEDVVGSEGTIIAASYTSTTLRFSKEKIIFTRDSLTTSGAFSKIILSSDKCVRSGHPTNSYAGIGPLAQEILSPQDSTGLSYDPIGRIIALGGKNLMLGTIDAMNAPMVLHYVQEIAGYTKKHPLSGFSQAFYKENDGVHRFVRTDVGGCSSGAIYLYGFLLRGKKTNFGFVGSAPSIVVDAKESFDIVHDIFSQNRHLTYCNDYSCVSCYGRFSNGIFKCFRCYVLNFYKLIKRGFKK